MSASLCCPVCRARFRGAAECSRCGADLTALMVLAAHAYLLRQSARQALRQGDYRTALASAQAAEQLHATEHSRVLRLVCIGAGNPLQADR